MDCIYIAFFLSADYSERFKTEPQERLGVQCFAQGHFDPVCGVASDGTRNLPITR